MRIIDADFACKGCVRYGTSLSCEECVVNDAPTVDAVPVVRCKECKYHEDEEIGMVYCPNMIGGWVVENWFCADGKRKEGGD